MPRRRSKDASGSESKQAKPAPIQTGALSKFQAFTTETVHRSVLKNAVYNPRHITERGKVKLRGVLERVGLVQPLVWNRRSGNLVGGHQRIKALDTLEGKSDYLLTVSVVDVDEKREKELNLLLNNTDVGGEWELDKLKGMLQDTELDLVATGFDEAELLKLFGEAPAKDDGDHGKELSEKLQDMKDTFANLERSEAAKDDRDYYNVVVFGTADDRLDFLKEFGFEDNRYIHGPTLVAILRDYKARANGVGDVNGSAVKTELPLEERAVPSNSVSGDVSEGAAKPT